MRASCPWLGSLIALGTLALAIRLWGVGFGLPDLFHPDEPAYVLQALALARGLPNGLTFADPPLFKYALLAEFALTYAVERALGLTHSAQEMVDQFRANPSLLYTIARVTSVVTGALTAVGTAVLGAYVGGRRVGALAGGLAAVAYLLVRESHFGVNDALLALLVTFGLVFCVRIALGGDWRDYVAAGAVTGLAFSAKYDGLVLLAPLAVAHVLAPGRRRWRDLALALGACVAGAVLTFPSLLTEPGRVVNDINVHLLQFATGGYDGLDPSGGYPFYARALGLGIGWPLVVMAVAGMVLSALRRDVASLVVAMLPFALLLALGSQRLYFARFALPAIPALLVEASLALEVLLRRNVVVGVVATLVVGLPTLVDAARFDALLTQTDTRTLAREWIENELPAGASIAVDAPPLGPSLADDQSHQVLVANDWSLFDLTPADYRARGVEYLVVSSFTAEARAVDPVRDARRVAFYAGLSAAATPLAQFAPYTGETQPPFAYDAIYAPWDALDQLARPGPTLTVYRFTE